MTDPKTGKVPGLVEVEGPKPRMEKMSGTPADLKHQLNNTSITSCVPMSSVSARVKRMEVESMRFPHVNMNEPHCMEAGKADNQNVKSTNSYSMGKMKVFA